MDIIQIFELRTRSGPPLFLPYFLQSQLIWHVTATLELTITWEYQLPRIRRIHEELHLELGTLRTHRGMKRRIRGIGTGS